MISDRTEASMAARRADESKGEALMVDFDRRLILPFRGSVVTSDAGLLADRELDDALDLTNSVPVRQKREIRRARLVSLALLASIGAMTLGGADLWPPTQAQAAQSLPKSLTVLGKTLVLKDSHDGGSGGKFIAEYIPGDETFDNWTLMFASRFVPGAGLDPMASAVATANRISARKQSGDVLANSAIFKAPDGKSVLIDFLIFEGNIIEQNVFRYFNTRNGLVSIQIARRIYVDKAKESGIQVFIKSIKAKRGQIFNETMRADLPVSQGAK